MYVSCPHCEEPFLYDHTSGQRVVCPHCHQEVQFAAPQARSRKKPREEGKEVPREPVVGNRYPGLKVISGVYLVVAAMYLLGGLYSVWTIVAAAMDGAPASYFLGPVAVLAGCVLAALSCWGISELIHLFVHVADDVRIARSLLKRLVLGNKDADKNA